MPRVMWLPCMPKIVRQRANEDVHRKEGKEEGGDTPRLFYSRSFIALGRLFKGRNHELLSSMPN